MKWNQNSRWIRSVGVWWFTMKGAEVKMSVDVWNREFEREKPKQRAETDWVLHRSEALLRLNCLISRPCVPVLVCTCAMVWWMAERVISTKHTGIHNGFSFGLCGHNWLWHYVWSASMVVPQPMCSMCCSHSSHNSKSKDGQKKYHENTVP